MRRTRSLHCRPCRMRRDAGNRRPNKVPGRPMACGSSNLRRADGRSRSSSGRSAQIAAATRGSSARPVVGEQPQQYVVHGSPFEPLRVWGGSGSSGCLEFHPDALRAVAACFCREFHPDAPQGASHSSGPSAVPLPNDHSTVEPRLPLCHRQYFRAPRAIEFRARRHRYACCCRSRSAAKCSLVGVHGRQCRISGTDLSHNRAPTGC